MEQYSVVDHLLEFQDDIRNLSLYIYWTVIFSIILKLPFHKKKKKNLL